jgi:hypothetical protein
MVPTAFIFSGPYIAVRHVLIYDGIFSVVNQSYQKASHNTQHEDSSLI